MDDQSNIRKVDFLFDPGMATYDLGPSHPFRAQRMLDFDDLVKGTPLDDLLVRHSFSPATNEDLLTVHRPSYLTQVYEYEETGGYLSPDTQVIKGTPDASKLITGAVLEGVRIIHEEGSKHVFTFGGFHHAGRNYGEGFCLFNDVAVAAQAFIDRFGLDRVIIIDTDAHQGNGTMDIFYEDPKVLFISLHQDPRTLYPGTGFIDQTGKGDGEGYTVNIPMPMLSASHSYDLAMSEVVAPIAEEFKPQVMIRNGGADPHYSDQLTMLGLDMAGLKMVCRHVGDLSRSLEVPLLDLSISGYGGHTPYGWLSMLAGTAGHPYEVDYSERGLVYPDWLSERGVRAAAASVLGDLKRTLSDHWSF